MIYTVYTFLIRAEFGHFGLDHFKSWSERQSMILGLNQNQSPHINV